MTQMLPSTIQVVDENYVKVSQLINDLDAAMIKATDTVPVRNRKLLTYHDSFPYTARRYGYEIIGAIQPQSFSDPTPADVASLIEQVKEEQVPAVFGSEVFPSPVLEQIGKEAGVRYVDTLRDDDLPGEADDPDHSWGGLMRYNFVTIVEALGGDASALKKVEVDLGLKDKAYYPQ
jgi:ABC-type Zn uptake system ZnuABC Zn-binding protein ZnuA